MDALQLYHQLMHENNLGYVGMPPGPAGPPLTGPPLTGFNPYPGSMPVQFNGGYYPAGPPPNGSMPHPQMVGYPQMQPDPNQMYAGSAPPPPTPPTDHKQHQNPPQSLHQAHFSSPQQST